MNNSNNPASFRETQIYTLPKVIINQFSNVG